MSIHIIKFVDRLKAFESRNAKEFSCSINDARDLHRDITKLLAELEAIRTSQTSSEDIQVVMQGGSF